MDYDILEKGKYYEVVLENGKSYKIDKVWADNSQKSLDLGLVDVLDMWLEDNGVFENEEQAELDTKAKGVVKLNAKAETPKKKTQRERVIKENPDKEYIVGCVAEYLEELQATDINITNKSKLIEFTFKGKQFKLDLVEKRVKKAEK